MWIKRTSVISGIARNRNVPVNPDDYMAWQAGIGSIEDLMPYLTNTDRDFILSGITDDEWHDMFEDALEEEVTF